VPNGKGEMETMCEMGRTLLWGNLKHNSHGIPLPASPTMDYGPGRDVASQCCDDLAVAGKRKRRTVCRRVEEVGKGKAWDHGGEKTDRFRTVSWIFDWN
jgi:hypothetical protein